MPTTLDYYFGSTGGGVWKTIDGGNEWFPILIVFLNHRL
jgi:hypothetical protein